MKTSKEKLSFACGLSTVLGLLINTNKFGAKSTAPLLRVRVNIPAQWLIGFNSPLDCWSCAGWE
ncbi:hypothetical protein F6O75_03815 [Streptococcus suis]|nr:hypothetical protein [Streptococcus suis]MBL1189622.1 hypothetical protein [Streptococcus suis]MBO8094590.1 hypothetical protein [Streptococcus suis]MBO8117973.1 hypothetical protein [Streptococcus suis]MBS7870500.1 hypothetical protein [Streptococcus suis]